VTLHFEVSVMWHGGSFLARLKIELLLPMKTAFPSVYSCILYAGALAFSASTAVCEASFSVNQSINQLFYSASKS